MSEDKFKQAVDDWYDKLKVRVGEKKQVSVGVIPVDFNVGLHANIMNEYVTTDLIRHFADATGDRNPLYLDEEYAGKSVWGGIIAPPTITDAIAISWPSRRGRLSDFEDFELAGLPAGSKRQWFQPIRAGEKYQVFDEFISLEEKERKHGGPRLFVETNRRSYVNEKNETTAWVDARMVHMATPPGPLASFTGGERARHQFTDEERDAIYKGYETETRRGADTRQWDEVQVGEKLDTMVKGPVTTWDTAAWLSAFGSYAVAFDVFWEVTKADFKFAYFDEKANYWKCGGEGHLCDGAGHSNAFSGGHAFAYGAQIEALLARNLANWMGDGGFLKEMDCKFRAIPIVGDAYHIKAEVTNKYEEGNEKIVELSTHCENQDGLVLVPGTAKVRLP